MIIIRSKKQSKFEQNFIENFLIDKVDKNIFVDPKQYFKLGLESIKNKELLIIYQPGNEDIYIEVNDFLKKLNSNYILIHLSDETLEGKNLHYKNAKVILRSYFDPFSNNKNIFTIPVGYQNGFENTTEFNVQKHMKRKFVWSFFGQIYSTRENMIKELENIKPNYLHRTSSFMSSDIVSPEEIKTVYENSIFSPCPYGYLNPDSFRIMESLESGCIPIVQKFLFIDYYKLIFGDHPFIVLNKWKSVEKEITNLLSNPKALEKKQEEVWKWYKNFKIDLKRDILSIYKGETEELKSKQFIYQKNFLTIFLIKIAFFYWFIIRKNSIFIKINRLLYKYKKIINFNLKI